MREFELVIEEPLRKGLSPERNLRFNGNYIIDCLGVRCGKLGLEKYSVLDDPFAGGIVPMYYNWPFPQVIAGESWTILIVRDSAINHEDLVYSVSDDNVLTHIFSIDELTFDVGTLMQVADFGEYAIMTNGVILIYWDPALAAWIETAAHANIPLMRTICNFKGQAVGGGVTSVWHDCDETFYVWSKIGEMDFTPDDRNTSGYRRDPFGGNVFHVMRLGDHVVGYSSKGVTLMTPVNDPAVTFKFTEISDVGAINRGAVNGNLQRHVYLGSDEVLREVTMEGVKELDYRYYMDDLTGGEDVIINYEPANRDFYIGNSEMTFLLSPYGLTKIHQHPSTVWRAGGTYRDSYMMPETEDEDDHYVETTIYDMGYRGQKTVFSIESDILYLVRPQTIIGWANSINVWGYTNPVDINDEGIASVIIAGCEFVFKITWDRVEALGYITYIKVRYKMTDLRGLRGVYAPPPRGQG